MLPIFGLLGSALQIFTEIYPLAHAAVVAVQTTAPADTPGAEKFQAASKMVNDALNAATVVSGQVDATKSAIAGGNPQIVAASIGHSIELALSLCKTFGLFPKAAVVQAAPELDNLPAGTGAGA